nr:hypothetical protein [Frankia sp. Cas3]
MSSVDQQHLDLLGLAQGVEDWLPVHPSRLHRHVRNAFLDQPRHHLQQHLVEGLVHADLLTTLPRGIPGRTDGDGDLPLAHIDPRTPRIDDLHGNSCSTNPPDQAGHAIRGTRKKIKILRLALYGSNPGYPTGTGSSVNLRAGLAGTKNWRRQRMTCPVSSTRGRSTRPMNI